MSYKKFHCADCNHSFVEMVGETALTAICPGCGRIAKLIRFEMDLGLTFGEAVVGLLLGYTAYKLLTGFSET